MTEQPRTADWNDPAEVLADIQHGSLDAAQYIIEQLHERGYRIEAQAHPAAAPGAPRQRRSSRAWGLLNRWASWAKPITGLSKKSWEVLLTDTLAYLDEPEDEAARPAVASEGLRAALERLVKWSEALPGGIPDVTPLGWDNLRACIEQARAALASDAGRSVGADEEQPLRIASPEEITATRRELQRMAGSVGALDVERLAKAMSVSLDMYGWDLDSMARDIAAAYDAERQGES